MTTSHDLAIEAAGLTKRFGATVALDGVDLAAARGTVLGVLGPNGAGKTTAVRVLATLLSPDGGTARIAGHDVVRDAAAVRRQGPRGRAARLVRPRGGREPARAHVLGRHAPPARPRREPRRPPVGRLP